MASKKQTTITTDDVAHIAKLANLPLTPDEIRLFAGQLGETLQTVAQLDEVTTDGKEPTSQVTGLETVLDDDTPRASFSQAVALENTKSSQNGYFKVNAVFEEQ